MTSPLFKSSVTLAWGLPLSGGEGYGGVVVSAIDVEKVFFANCSLVL
jgi:hypothetical protein